MKPALLPTYYYLDHFQEMLSFVEVTYATILREEHHIFIRAFRALSKPAQCLLVRMVNRRGTIFALNSLHYSEIGELESLIVILMKQGWVRPLYSGDYQNWLARHTKDELLALITLCGVEGAKKTWQKAKLVQHLLNMRTYDAVTEAANPAEYIVLTNTPVEYLLYLYFGKTQDNLISFTLRDLGIVQTNSASAFKARFEDQSEAEACFFYRQWLNRLKEGSTTAYEDAADALQQAPFSESLYADSLKGEVSYQLGLFFEKAGTFEKAQWFYRYVPHPKANERLVRLLYKHDRRTDAKALLEQMMDDPGSDEEHLFASDFYARKFHAQRVGVCTDLLRRSEKRAIDEIHRSDPEGGVASQFRREGWRVYFTENRLWRNLFGLLFWDELFSADQWHSSFDRIPQSLKNHSFTTLYASVIEQKLSAVCAKTALPYILKTIASYWGTLNGIVNWNTLDSEALSELLISDASEGVASILARMAEDFRATCDGFPDLMLSQKGTIQFVEVKAIGDAIRRNQLTRMRQLEAAGICVKICAATYRFDSQQDYVVVDIETTGGSNVYHRITEIGAVKIRNHQVIAQWHSLIYPERSIPSHITQFTGITNAMVRNAPRFSDIAESFSAFMAESIFVAHNVNFDYGFISGEYKRLGQFFHYPKFCTCAGMRRYFPGHASYSLANLCNAYNIDLSEHHRALCDANAAAGLLTLINKRRETLEPQQESIALHDTLSHIITN